MTLLHELCIGNKQMKLTSNDMVTVKLVKPTANQFNQTSGSDVNQQGLTL